ncbi:hypothetical protein [Legionella impletisoli]|uniref:Uncharacterized protein n=1 Tax=Legionella impletisoli TaxID=343510 RepID=A0A917N7Q1_9GAMM|nr:hypothetical protein [Legionella impletisoli]GGI75616.1 hypothetical protein GCM10007966_00490 [Legionella impletisoli]
MQHTTTNPSVSGSADNGLSVSGGALGLGGHAEIGVGAGNLTTSTSSAVNWGDALSTEEVNTSSIGQSGISSGESRMTQMGGSNGFSTHESRSESIGGNGYRFEQSEGINMGGREVYSSGFSNDNCCCTCNCSCCGSGVNCSTEGCCESISDCCSSCFGSVKDCLGLACAPAVALGELCCGILSGLGDLLSACK